MFTATSPDRLPRRARAAAITCVTDDRSARDRGRRRHREGDGRASADGSGFDVEWADDGTKGLRKLRFERPDVCVVDLMLPGLDGWGLIERARDEGLQTPILAVSARGNEHDKVATLARWAPTTTSPSRSGWPSSWRACRRSRAARASRRPRSASRRSSSRACASIPRSTAHSCSAPRATRPMPGSRAPSSACSTSWRATPGRVLSRDELHQRVWDVPYRHRDRTVDVFVRKLREKLDRRSPLRLRAHALRRGLSLRRRGARQRRGLTADVVAISLQSPSSNRVAPGRPPIRSARTPNSSSASITSTPAERNWASIASRSATRKFTMNACSGRPKYSLSRSKMAQVVEPPGVHSNGLAPQSEMSTPRCSAYQSRRLAACPAR